MATGEPSTEPPAPAATRPATTAVAVDRRSPVPLWAQVADDLRRRLAAPAFGDAFPTEQQLVAEYGVSRHTVREALRELRQTGVVVAERGRGSRIDRSRIDQPLGTLYSVFREVEARGMEQSSTVLRLEPTTDAAAASELRLPAGAELIVLERVRFAGTEPLAVDTAWLPAALAQPLLGADFAHASLYDKLARRCGARVDSGRERIRPVVADEAQARLLRIDPGTPVFHVERLGCVGDRPVEWRRSVVRGDRFAFVAEWSLHHPDLGLSAEPVPTATTIQTRTP